MLPPHSIEPVDLEIEYISNLIKFPVRVERKSWALASTRVDGGKQEEGETE